MAIEAGRTRNSDSDKRALLPIIEHYVVFCLSTGAMSCIAVALSFCVMLTVCPGQEVARAREFSKIPLGK
jgi:hypothetical protein